MCGITACVGTDDTVETLLSGLQNLEYRGYDSAGLAVQNGHGVDVFRREGEVSQLEMRVRVAEPSAGALGIGHTRWSTHGPPSDENAHPHTDCTGSIAVVHNGIIENHEELKAELRDQGHMFTSETDTEVIPHLVEEFLSRGQSVDEAFRNAMDRLDGSYAVAMISELEDTVYASRSGSPLVLGLGDDARYLASDVPAFLEYTDRVIYLEDGDVVKLTPDGYRITDGEGERVDRTASTVEWVPGDAEKSGYDHYMLKEIHEQPSALRQTIQGRVYPQDYDVELEEVSTSTFDGIERVQFVACGTSYHAAVYGSQLLNERGVQADAFLASEYVVNPPPAGENTLVVGVTQSGETADTLAALRAANQSNVTTLAVTNVVGSTAARECDDALFIRAGPEIGVAATKTFSSQVAALCILAEHLAPLATDTAANGHRSLLSDLAALPGQIDSVLTQSSAGQLAQHFSDSDSYFFIGRGTAYPVALEGALKLKEITYEHAEGFAAGELKHGPLALVTSETPVVAIATGRHDEKLRSNIEEVQARGAPVIVAANEESKVAETADYVLDVGSTHPDLAGVLANVQLQLLAYHTADLLDRPIDKPRNLAKSVTVE
ncbi:glutamine--fructose-6-phosphate transaminase (isomerizing) [Haloarculaceae archaeon H-GB2-1]|nr:glutamine--fructose-6-phosphate transaminase (isomerizing) [Haloarculaceae archaeon H-GB1-1]MEA5389579.1 glutamine--fructose-6-phosphate transaminase (isomerizing) [Haloarculaceae archaeon H-GB11]MEA5409968.1 glutamine--fructose-6-phosphate transaminase (isomerizing) [Haloarculaceae archaeon H-GB2-1]